MYRFIVVLFFSFTMYSQNSTTQKNMKLIQPPYLQKGDTVIIVAPSGTLQGKEEFIEKGIQLMKSWGLNVIKGKHLYDNAYHFSATDENRKKDFQNAIDNPYIKAIWCARGGYGTTRIIDDLNFTQFQKHPKWVIGYSDITALHSHIHNLGVESIHGAMPIDFKNDIEDIMSSLISLKEILFGKKISYEIPPTPFNQNGTASGQLIGGNLTLLQNLVGSHSEVNTDNKILFIEEIGEYKYHIDRMLIGLKRAGFFKKCNGIIVGKISNIKRNTPAFHQTIEEIILKAVGRKDIPILFDFPAGHELINKALLLGRKVKINVKTTSFSTLTFD